MTFLDGVGMGEERARCTAVGLNRQRCKVTSNLSAAGYCIWHDEDRKAEAMQLRSGCRINRQVFESVVIADI